MERRQSRDMSMFNLWILAFFSLSTPHKSWSLNFFFFVVKSLNSSSPHLYLYRFLTQTYSKKIKLYLAPCHSSFETSINQVNQDLLVWWYTTCGGSTASGSTSARLSHGFFVPKRPTRGLIQSGRQRL